MCLSGIISALLCAAPAAAGTIRVESLKADIAPETVGVLAGLACRNVDRIVRLRLAIAWPDDAMTEEKDGFKRLVFWTRHDEFLFPAGAYRFQHGAYRVDGYFIARSGGVHQGIVSNAFEKIDDTAVMLSPAVHEAAVRSASCR